MKTIDQPATVSQGGLSTEKDLLALIRERRPVDLVGDLLAVLRARWYLRDVNEVGNRVRVWGHPFVKNLGRMTIGNHVRLYATITPIELSTLGEGTLQIEDGVFLNYGCSIAATECVRIGANCSIGTYAVIMDNNFHRVEPDRRNEYPDPAPVILEENIWLGARVIVLPGVTIGRDSVIGAGSVVTHSIPPRSIAAGVPARVLRTL